MLILLGLEKSYGNRRVLAGADLSVGAGDAVALVGGNGSGKTTTLRCIVGLARPDAGRVEVDGVDALVRPREALARVSYLPQKPSFPATLTALEVIGVAARLRRQPPAVVEREIEQCGLTTVANRVVSQMSGGERQRVGLAVTFVADVPLYVFDEPSASLDPLATAVLIERARRLRKEGRAVLYSTHVAADIDQLATRVALLRHGRIEIVDDPDLCGEAATAPRPATAGERALQRLEVENGELVGGASVAAMDGRRVGDHGGRVWERFAGTAAAAVGPR